MKLLLTGVLPWSVWSIARRLAQGGHEVTLVGLTEDSRGGGSGVLGDMLGLGVGVAAAGAIAPQIGKKNGKPCLYVAYGIYGDISRRDNDHQILLEYRLTRFNASAKEPKADAKYFIYTGNTTWGIQNLAYDPATGCIFMAAYAGKKPEFPNYSLFAVPVDQKPASKILRGLENDGKHLTLALWQQGLLSSVKGIRGWRFGKGTTGMCPLGDGRWYFSTPEKHKKWQTATVELLQWKGGPGEVPFEACGSE